MSELAAAVVPQHHESLPRVSSAAAPSVSPAAARAQRLAGSLLCLLGALTLVAWALRLPRLLVPVPDWIAIVPNTGLGFLLLGVALLFGPAGCRGRLPATLAALTALIAGQTLAQHLLEIDFGLDDWLRTRWLDDSNPHPGRMAPQTVIAFLAACVAFACLQGRFSVRREAAVHALLTIIAAIGLFGAAGYVLGLALLYSWYQHTAMAVQTTVGFLILAVGLHAAWLARRRQAIATGELVAAAGGLLSRTLVIAGLVLVGLTGAISLAGQTEELLRRNLQTHVVSITRAVDTELAASFEIVAGIANRVAILEPMARANADADDTAVRRFLQQVVDSAVIGNTTAFVLHGVNGALLAQGGRLAAAAGFDAALEPGARLLWRDGFLLQRRVPLALKGEPVGFVDIELRLPRMSQALGALRSLDQQHTHPQCPAAAIDDLDRRLPRVEAGGQREAAAQHLTGADRRRDGGCREVAGPAAAGFAGDAETHRGGQRFGPAALVGEHQVVIQGAALRGEPPGADLDHASARVGRERVDHGRQVVAQSVERRAAPGHRVGELRALGERGLKPLRGLGEPAFEVGTRGVGACQLAAQFRCRGRRQAGRQVALLHEHDPAGAADDADQQQDQPARRAPARAASPVGLEGNRFGSTEHRMGRTGELWRREATACIDNP